MDINESAGGQWFLAKKGDAHKHTFSAVSTIKERQRSRFERNIHHLALYGNIDPDGNIGVPAGHISRAPGVKHLPNTRLNIINSMVQTVVAKLTKNKVRPRFLTLEGPFKDKKKAQRLEKFTDGLFYKSRFYEKAPIALMDSCVFDIGVLKIYEDGEDIHVERVFPNEIYVDNADAVMGKPSQMHQVKSVPKDALIARFPEYRTFIEEAGSDISNEYQDARTQLVETVDVVESWKLAQGKTKGRHTITISNKDLLDEEWSYDYFPFVFLRWTNRLSGFHGMSLAEELVGLQLEINTTLRNIQLCIHLCSKPTYLIESNSNVVTAHLNNQIGNIIKYNTIKPELQALNAVPPELFTYLNFLIERAYEITGVSQLSAQSKKPPGLNAAVALQEFHDIESERFFLAGKNYEDFTLDAARQMIDRARDLHRKNGKYEVVLSGKRYAEVIDWGDIDLKEDSYTMQVFPSNLLPSTPSGKLSTIEKLLAMQLPISPEEVMSLLDFPDVDKVMSRARAEIDIIDMMIDQILDPEEPQFIAPDEHVDPQLALGRARQAYAEARSDGAGPEHLDGLELFMSVLEKRIEARMVKEQAIQESAPEQLPA